MQRHLKTYRARRDGFHNFLDPTRDDSGNQLPPPTGGDIPGGGTQVPSPMIYTAPNPVYDINYSSLSCGELQQKISELNSLMSTLPPSGSTYSWYANKLSEAQAASTTACVTINCLVPPCPDTSDIGKPPNPNPTANPGSNNSTTNIQILPSATGGPVINPGGLIGGGGAGGGGSSNNTSSAKKDTTLIALLKNKNLWWLVALGAIGLALYKTSK